MNRKICDCDAQMLVALVAGTVFGVICGIAFYAVVHPVLELKDWAVWVQAVGVILAVLVAIWVPYKERKSAIQRERARKALETYEMVRAVFLLAGQASRAMGSSTKKIAAAEKPIRVDRLVNVQNSFTVLLGKEIPAEAVNLILEIQCELAYQISAIELNNAGHNNLRSKVGSANARKRKVKTASCKLDELLRSLAPTDVEAGKKRPERVQSKKMMKGLGSCLDESDAVQVIGKAGQHQVSTSDLAARSIEHDRC